MKYQIDLTGENFDIVDFQEAEIIDFFYQLELSTDVKFKTWGATLLLAPSWQEQYQRDKLNLSPDYISLFNHNEDMYISGMGNITLTNVIGGYIEVYVYDTVKNEFGHVDVIKNRDGSELVYKKTWDCQTTDNTQEYLWECVITWPFGFCVLHLFSDNGTANLEFDGDDLMPVAEYVRAPLKYSFFENHMNLAVEAGTPT